VGFYFSFFSFFLGLWKFFYLVYLVLVFFLVYWFFSVVFYHILLKKYFFRRIWYLGWLVGFRFSKFSFLWGVVQRKAIDQGWFEVLGPQGFILKLRSISYFSVRGQSYTFFLLLLSFFFIILVVI
jgi:hypothetical protein